MTEQYLIDACAMPGTPSLTDVQQQLHDFQTGFPFTNIVSAATLGNGISVPNETITKNNIDTYKIVKFVPASGAATRMFRDLYEYLATNEINKSTQTVLDNLDKFAFYDDLKPFLPENATNRDIIECIITNRGLNYGNLPKGLLQFHKYPDAPRTAISEHLAESAQYATSNGTVNIHFTVSPEHLNGFNKLLATLIPEYETKTGLKYNISLSTQKSETNTIAVNPDNTPFLDENGGVVFRPAGHGALIENLNDIDADIIFIKNIDNVCPEHRRADTIQTKCQLLNHGIEIQKKIFEYINALDAGTAPDDEIRDFIGTHLGYRPSLDTDLRSILNRPLRICGMVLNTGSPGGGPFWTRDSNGNQSLQIVEPGQISPTQSDILTTGQYFNPVDLVCFVRDYQGNKFDLRKFVDPETGFISEKSHNGRPLRAMERPGLWNGAMAHWNTVFIAVPGTTFTPAKVITDLIKPEHM